jgi:hypothetical protein
VHEAYQAISSKAEQRSAPIAGPARRPALLLVAIARWTARRERARFPALLHIARG